jgi:dGTPase
MPAVTSAPELSSLYASSWWLERPIDEDPPSEGDVRGPLQRDRDRVLHARAFRCLAGKTQVIGTPWAYNFRNRLTHTLEVNQVGRSLARKHGVDEDLVEAACLAHDIGHPPFGHAGERQLNSLMEQFGGFDANAQTLRALRKLEIKGSGRPGLNLTRAAFWAVIKYPYRRDGEAPQDGSVPPEDPSLKMGTGGTLVARSRYLYDVDLEDTVRDGKTFGDWLGDGKLEPRLPPQSRLFAPPPQTLGCQLMQWADDVAYAIHDFEDAVLARFITKGAIRRVHDPLLAAVRREVVPYFDGDDEALYGAFGGWEREIESLLERVQEAIDPEAALRPTTRTWFGKLVDAVRIVAPDEPDDTTVGYSVDVSRSLRVLVSLLAHLGFELMIRDERIVRYLRKGAVMLERCFNEIAADPKVVDERVGQLVPRHLAVRMETMDERQRARTVCDFLASMSEAGLTHLHATLFETSGGSPFY